MKSGGMPVEFTFNPQAAVERNDDKNTTLDAEELRLALKGSDNATPSNEPAGDAIVNWNGIRMTWAELKRFLGVGTKQLGEGRSVAQNNIEPREFVNQRLPANVNNANYLAGEIQQMRSALSGSFPVTIAGGTYNNRAALEAAINQKVQQLQQLIAQIRADNRIAGKNQDEGIRDILSTAGVSASDSGAGTGSFSSSSRGMSLPGQTGQPGPAGVQGQNGSRGIGFPGGAGVGTGDPLFDGFTPPTSAAYGAALYMDGQISDGLGQLGQSRREGQKLMMLFFYFARMAESGDPFAMYNFIKFITYIISKDKARQNIHIGSKLIQLQDLSRKASDLVTQSNTTDPNKVNDFMKTLHEAKSQEAMISTAQKLLADMLQEYAGVTEGLINSTRGLQDFWKRAVSTSTRP